MGSHLASCSIVTASRALAPVWFLDLAPPEQVQTGGNLQTQADAQLRFLDGSLDGRFCFAW